MMKKEEWKIKNYWTHHSRSIGTWKVGTRLDSIYLFNIDNNERDIVNGKVKLNGLQFAFKLFEKKHLFISHLNSIILI